MPAGDTLALDELLEALEVSHCLSLDEAKGVTGRLDRPPPDMSCSFVGSGCEEAHRPVGLFAAGMVPGG
jgi:hypothetical protein